jgi:hypothetical protein
MPRPKKKGFGYFPLDTDFFGNKKTKALRRAHGDIGILTYINLMCKVYAKGYYYEFTDIDELANDIAEEITNVQLARTATCVTETINYLVGRGILDEGLFKRGIISGEALQEQFVLSAQKSKRKIEMDVYCLVDVLDILRKNEVSSEETEVTSEETAVTSEEGTQNKSKSKINNIHTTTNNNSIFLFNNAREREEKENVGKPVEKGCGAEPPTVAEVFFFFRKETELAKSRCFDEAQKFIDYNSLRKWQCLPDWHAAARRWVEKGTI